MRSLAILVVCLALVLNLGAGQGTPTGYVCNVPNCQYCSFVNFCGVCNNNYILQFNSSSSQPFCQSVVCNVANCANCYQTNICATCFSGFYVSTTGTCTLGNSPNTCSANCLACNSTQCLLCPIGYNLLNGGCFPNNGITIATTGNCQSAFSGFTCQLCVPNYYVNTAYQCVASHTFNCQITNCAVCTMSNGQESCTECLPTYQLQGNTCTQRTCTISNCQICANNATCSNCLPEFVPNANNNLCQPKIYQCNVANCVLCKSANVCTQCSPGYIVTPQTATGSNLVIGSTCTQVTSSSGGQVQVTNCLQYGQMVPGTSGLSIGCVNCQSGFINVGGYCVANITQASYTCNVANCAYCVQNNICGQCATGYTVFLGTGNICIRNYSPIPNCMVPLMAAVATPLCAVCSPGYALVDNLACVSISNLVCNIVGCSYCITNNTCSACMNGYTLNSNNNSCTASCSVPNCYQCLNNLNCQTCSYGYYLNNNNCVPVSQSQSFCNTTFGSTCTACTNTICTQCASGTVINTVNGNCCPPITNNIANCASYSTTWGNTGCQYSITCTACQLGSILTAPFSGQPQCLSIPCTINNCAYCFHSTVCLVCKQGYNLVNNVCTSYVAPSNCNVPNCVACSNNVCTSCLNGYLLYNGTCVCNFQNCLACQGGAFCTACAFPTIATMTSSAGCLPQIVPNTLCNVANCMNCQSVNFCAQCDNGFSLQSSGACTQNVCNRQNNCTLCNANQTVCFVCNPGFIPNGLMAAGCVSISAVQNYTCKVTGCSVCSSANVCQVCTPFFTLSNGACNPFSCISNCVACLSNNTCLVCQAGFYLTTGNTCAIYSNVLAPSNTSACPIGSSAIAGCVGCQTTPTGTINCIQCTWGLMPASNGQSCIAQTCSVPYCQICVQNKQFNNGLQMCFVCQQGYFMNSNFQCVSYNPTLTPASCSGIYNCLYCSSNNYCSLCPEGWNPINGSCVTTTGCLVNNCASCTTPGSCSTCAANYQLVSNICNPLCNINGCTSCASLTTCATCGANFQPNAGNTACNCPTSNGFVLNGNACTCPSPNTLVGTSCFTCNPSVVPNCLSCSANNVCQTCASGFGAPVNGQCVCSSPYTIVNGTCQCPAGQLPYTNSSGTVCITCNVQYCQYCTSSNTCGQCLGTLILTTNNGTTTCGCNDNTFTISSSYACICNSTTTLIGNTCVSCTTPNCQSCTSANVCGACVNNLVVNSNGNCVCSNSSLTPYNGYCYPCSPNYCSICSSANVCVQCNTGFVLVPGGTCGCATNYTLSTISNTCVLCNISNCVQCNTAGNCAQCANYYTQITNPSSCIACLIDSCITCSSPNYCSSCSNGLQINSLGNMCITCGVTNCAVCLNSFTCATCSPGFQPSANSRFCLNCSIQGCAACNTSTTCQACLTGYSLTSSSQCSLCSYPCATCGTTPSSCLTCVAPYSTNAANGVCYSCNVANCAQCNQATPYTCTLCASGYSIQGSTCVYTSVCSKTCAVCTLNQYCQQCISGYTISPSNSAQCIACNVTSCATCSSSDITTCLSCVTGYYVVNGLCQRCPSSNCQTCNANGCLTFQPSTRQIAVTINNQTYPAICDPGCLTCSSVNPTACSLCAPGYAKTTGNVCIPCTYPCLSCNPANPSQCYSCYGNMVFTPATNQCTPCANSSKCLTCSATNTSKCTTCLGGYSIGSSGTCSLSCPYNCLACSVTNSNFCTTCASGYSANPSGVCLPCLANCRVCSGTAQAICLSCGAGFYLSSSSTCVACQSNCQSCNANGCLTCNPGFYIGSTQQCLPVCTAPCATCSATNPASCTSCLLGYSYSSTTNTCSPITNCPNGVCYACPIGYTLSSNVCVQCTPNSNCARCNPSVPSSCTSCINGYYLNTVNNACAKCPSGCATCSSSSNCITCASGSTLALQPVSSAGYCASCVYPCSQCLGSTTTCTSCVSGYSLNGWNCQSNFNFGFFVSLNTNLATFYSNYQGFLNALVGSNAYFKEVTLTSIVSGSVNVTGTVSTSYPSGSNAAGTQFYTLQDVLKASTIAGMPISSSYVAPNGGSVPPNTNPSTNNLALILGICIPLAVIIIGVIVYFVVVKKSCQKDDQTIEYKTNNTTVRETFELTTRGEPTL